MDNNTYVHILLNTLIKKSNLLDELIELTKLQETYIATTPFDMDVFEQSISKKESIIEQLNQLDEGFDKVYEHVKVEISTDRVKHKDGILRLQELIKQVTEKSVKLQKMELQNKGKLEVYFSKQKKEIKNFKMSSKTASNYYKNIANQQDGQSYFLDKKNKKYFILL